MVGYGCGLIVGAVIGEFVSIGKNNWFMKTFGKKQLTNSKKGESEDAIEFSYLDEMFVNKIKRIFSYASSIIRMYWIEWVSL